jgi:hypothetical protein
MDERDRPTGKLVQAPKSVAGHVMYDEMTITVKAMPTAQVRARDFTPVWTGEMAVLPELYEARPAEVVRALLKKMGHNAAGEVFLPAR